MQFFLAVLLWIISCVEGLSPVACIAESFCVTYSFRVNLPQVLYEFMLKDLTSRGHTWLLQQKLLISLHFISHNTNLKVKDIHLGVFVIDIESRQLFLMNCMCVCVCVCLGVCVMLIIPSPKICRGQLSDLQGSLDILHSLLNLTQSLHLLRRRLHIIFYES